MNWDLISSSKGLTNSGVSKLLGTQKSEGFGIISGSILVKTSLVGFSLLLVTTVSPRAIPIFVEAPTTTTEAPARTNFGTTGSLLFNTVEAAEPAEAAAHTFAVTFSTPSFSPLLNKSTALST